MTARKKPVVLDLVITPPDILALIDGLRERHLIVSRVRVGDTEVDIVGERRETGAAPVSLKDKLESHMVSAQEKADTESKAKEAAQKDYERTLFMASEG